MSEQDNIQIVKDAYADFGRGDVPSILDRFADDFQFSTPGAPEVTYAGTKRSREELAAFFAGLNDTVAMSIFDPREYFAMGDKVVVLGRYAGQVKASGHPFDGEWAMVWTFRDGKVVDFREMSDPSQLKKGFVSAG